jgi:hypothetical protein
VRYGGAPHAHGYVSPGFYGYPGGYYGPRYYGVGRTWYGPAWVAPPVVVGPVLSLGLWGYGGCGCAPAYECPPAYPVGPTYPLAPGSWVAPAPEGYLPPAPAPYPAPEALPQPQAPAPPLEQAPSAPAIPEVFPAPSPAPEGAPSAPETAPGAQDAQGPRPLSAEDEKALQQSLEEFRAGRYGAAQATLEAVVARSPDLGHAWLGIAHAAFASGRTTRASEALTQAALLGAFPRGYRFDPRALYAEAAEFDSRKQALEEHVRAKPADTDARLVLAWLRVSLGEREQARADLDAVLGQRPADAAAPLLSHALLPPAPEAEQQAPQAAPPPPGALPAQPPVPEAR